MVDIEALATRSRQVADRSRVRMACRVLVVIASLTCIPLLAGAHRASCVCLAVALFLTAAVLRWRDRNGIEAVKLGLAFGAIPLLAAVGLRACGIACAELGAFSEGELACFAAGAVAGAGVSFVVAHGSQRGQWRLLWTILVASLTASLGCVGLGMAGVLSTVVAMLASATLVWIPVSLRAAP